MSSFTEHWKKHVSHVTEDREGRVIDTYEDPDIEAALALLEEREQLNKTFNSKQYISGSIQTTRQS